jgi:hypothetical protein
VPCPPHPHWLDRSNYAWRRVFSSFLQPRVTSSVFSPNILLNTLFSKNPSLCFYHYVRDQVSHPYRTTSKMIEHMLFQNSILVLSFLCPI